MRNKKLVSVALIALSAATLSFISRATAVREPVVKPAPPVAEERLAIIVNKANPIENLSSAELRQFFIGEARSWTNGRRVTIVMREVGQPEREAVLRQIYRMSENDFTRHFLQAVYNGLLPVPPRALPTSDGMKKFVFNVPGAIGYARANEVDASVKVVRIDGLAPDAPGYRLKLLTK